jgi:polysaccharide biosynthesis protein PslA
MPDGCDERKSGRRISPQNCAAAFICVDVLAIIGLGKPAMEIGAVFGRRLAACEMLVLALIVALYIAFAYAARVYDERRVFDLRPMLGRAAIGMSLTFGLIFIVGFSTHRLAPHSALGFFGWAGLSFLIAATFRIVALRRIARAFQSGRLYVSRVLTVGVSCEPVEAAEIARRSKNRARTIRRVCVESSEDLGNLAGAVARDEIDRIYVTAALSCAPEIPRRLRLLKSVSCEVCVSPNDRETIGAPLDKPEAPDYVATTVIDIPFDQWRLWFKRLQDIVIATLVLILAAPLLLLLAAAIKLESPGPVLSRRRVACDDRPSSELWTFRSTTAPWSDAERAAGGAHDPCRVTRVGKLMRRASLDRAPLFLNVLQGGLSIVGPRPHWAPGASRGDDLHGLSARYAASHRVNPCLTGLAQVEGFRGELDCAIDIDRRAALDWAYVERRSMWLDFAIMIRTIGIVIGDCVAGRCAMS